MRSKILTLAAATILVAVPSSSWAAKPDKDATLTVAVAPAKAKFGVAATVSGAISSKQAGVALVLEYLAAPYDGKWTDTGTTTTAADGSYGFSVTPPTSTRYRVSTVDKPAVTSPEATLLVSWRVGLKVSDSTPTKGRLVKFSGTVKPANLNAAVFIQRRTPTGWKNVKQTTLSTGTATSSSYSVRVKILNSGTYRAAVLGDAAHETGISRVRRFAVG
jgi:hypothetical protein